jgi:hypothetical protein
MIGSVATSDSEDACSSMMPTIWRALAKYLWLLSGKFVHSLRKWLSARLASLHNGQDGLVPLRLSNLDDVLQDDRIFAFLGRSGEEGNANERNAFASSEVRISSNRDGKACEISGLTDAKVLDLTFA